MSLLQQASTYIIGSIMILLFTGCASSSLDQYAAYHQNSQPRPLYYISFPLENQEQWQLERNLIDEDGYTQYYILINQQNVLPQQIIVHYGRHITTPLIQTMQQIANGNRYAECKISKTKLIQKDNNNLIFTNTLKNCVGNQELWQVYKIFNRSDGQYAIIYTVEPHQISEKTRLYIQHIISLAQLVQYNKKSH
ncbi:hypothetical protein ACGP04_03425 [Piscirickettsia salmonis]|uniref:hypothetical protein n=1 Tax=Piscirickettsia salmonis TaxID=1238 RepID=UPI003750D39F